jgi:hypothetical protein
MVSALGQFLLFEEQFEIYQLSSLKLLNADLTRKTTYFSLGQRYEII